MSAILLLSAKWLPTWRSPPSERPPSSNPFTTLVVAEEAAKTTSRTSATINITREVPPPLNGAKVKIEGPSTMVLTESLFEVMPTPTASPNKGSETSIRLPATSGSYMSNPPIETSAPNHRLSKAPTQSEFPNLQRRMRRGRARGRESSTPSWSTSSSMTRCTCPSRPSLELLDPNSPNRRPTQRADESPEQYRRSVRQWEIRKERRHETLLAYIKYERQSSNLVRVQNPATGQWHTMPLLVASCPFHYLAAQPESERLECEKKRRRRGRGKWKGRKRWRRKTIG